jgi:curli biogenesis system outer membrane secretion channel CsgG
MISAPGRSMLVAAFASLALVAASASPSAAASATPAPKAAVAGQAVSGATDFSAAKRRYYRRGPNGGYRQPYAGGWTPAYRQDPRVWGDPRY